MAKKKSSDLAVYYGGYDFGTALTRVELTLGINALDPTSLSDAGERATGGLRADAVALTGLFDDINSADAAAAALIPTGTAVLSVLFGQATGDIAYSGTAFFLAAKNPASIGELVRQEVEIKLDQSLDRGMHYAKLAKAGTGAANSGTLDNTALTTAGGVGYIHVLSVTSGTVGAALQDSATGTLWADIPGARVTGSAGTSVKVSFTGTLNQYTKFTMEGTGIGTALGILVRS